MHLHGDHDTLAPTEANARELGNRYQKLNGDAQIVLLKGLGSERATCAVTTGRNFTIPRS